MKDIVGSISNLLEPLNEEEKQEILNQLLKTEGIPISAFKTKLSGLEIITKYLKEIENKSFKEISKTLNRSQSTIYNTYKCSKIKYIGILDTSDTSITIPYGVFTNRKFSVLESIVSYLKDHQKLSLQQISHKLKKSYNTIKTVYRRFKIKNG
jgi:hypothetical protein